MSFTTHNQRTAQSSSKMGGINLHHICTLLQKSILKIKLNKTRDTRGEKQVHIPPKYNCNLKNYVTVLLLSQHELQCSINSSYLDHKSTSVLKCYVMIKVKVTPLHTYAGRGIATKSFTTQH